MECLYFKKKIDKKKVIINEKPENILFIFAGRKSITKVTKNEEIKSHKAGIIK